ncbi:hypothetical protein MBLNU230_g7267t1 [Neophaeotheca triangularis]
MSGERFSDPLDFPTITWDHGSRQPLFLIVLGVFLFISLTTVSTRLYCRIHYVRSMGIDDWLMVSAMVVTTGLAIQNIFHVSYGTGLSMANYPPEPEKAFIPTLKHWWSYQIVYPLALALIKASLLATYWRIFTRSTFPRIWILIVGGVIAVFTVIVMFVYAFECNPVTLAWSPAFTQHPDQCINRHALYYAAAAFNILTDVIILVMPIRPLAKLNINSARRNALIGIFLVGGIAVAASCVRLYYVVWQANGSGPQTAIFILLWSQVEINVAITTASVPALRPLFSKAFSSTSRNYSNQANLNYPSAGPNVSGGGGASKLFSRSRRSGNMELGSIGGSGVAKDGTVTHQQDSDNNSEEMILGRPHGIMRTVETQIKTHPTDDDTEPLSNKRPDRRSGW